MATQGNSNTYSSRLRPRGEPQNQPVASALSQPNKKRSRNALRDVSNKNARNENEKKYKTLLDDSESNQIVGDERQHALTSRGEATINTRTSSRLRAKVVDNHKPQESSEIVERQCLKTLHKDDEERNEQVMSSTEAGPDQVGKFYEIVHPDYRLERKTFDGQTHTLGIAAHDRRNKSDVLFAVHYVSDIYQNLYSDEAKYHPRTYLQDQTDINSKMRAILVDWLVEVHAKFRLAPETLYLCINILDRYCKLIHVKRSRLQLVGVTALLLACKYEEIHPPEVRDFVYITDRAYTRRELLDMEQDILHELKFQLTVPTAYPFLQRYLHLLKASAIATNCANYFLERTLQEHTFLDFRPSLVAASAVVLAINNEEIIDFESQRNCDPPGIPLILLEYTGFKEAEILACAHMISWRVDEETVTASKRLLIAVKNKYRDGQYGFIGGIITRPPNVPQLESTIKA